MSAIFRILFVGNSYTTRNDMPSLIRELAAAAGIELEIETEVIAFGGASLAAHWNRGEVQAALGERKWDAVVLQDQSTRPLRALKSMQQHVRLLVPAIQQAGTQALLYVTWAKKHAPDSQHEITNAYRDLAEQTGASLVPVGPVWQELGRLCPDLELYDRDLSHPSFAGSYVAACVFLVSLFGKMPPGVNRVKGSLTEAQTELIHELAWQSIGDHMTRHSIPPLRGA